MVNYHFLFKSVTQMLKSWDIPSISWLGLIRVIKLIFLPKLLYSFRVLLILVPPATCRSLQRLLLKCIWDSTRSQLNRTILYWQKTKGGLGVPNISLYYKAAQIVLVQLHTGNLAPKWIFIDVLDSDPIPLSLIPWIPPAVMTETS